MNILVCPDSFKGTLTSRQVCDIVEEAIREKDSKCNIVKLPIADGGEGLCEALYDPKTSEKIYAKTKNPFNEDIEAQYIIINKDTAVIEMASCAGLPLAGNRLNPLYTSTYGVGLMILDALHRGITKIILGLGGSCTNDCGIGMAKALGYDFIDSNGNSLNPTGENLIKVKHIVKPQNIADAKVIAACDVNNPLYGKNGAAYVFAPQKGADEKAVKLLDAGLRNISMIIEEDLKLDVSCIAGAGAAGGLGAGTIAFLNGELKSGIDIVLDALRFDEYLKDADAVITGEGKFDCQSSKGKVISGVCKRAVSMDKAVFALCGCADKNADYKALGIETIVTSSKETKNIDIIRKTVKNDVKYSASKLFSEIIDFFRKNTCNLSKKGI